jgi:hypothetical protein
VVQDVSPWIGRHGSCAVRIECCAQGLREESETLQCGRRAVNRLET